MSPENLAKCSVCKADFVPNNAEKECPRHVLTVKLIDMALFAPDYVTKRELQTLAVVQAELANYPICHARC